MKKIFALLLALMLLILPACASNTPTEPYTVEKDYKVFTVDPEAGTITEGNNVYEYKISGDSDSYSISITYPNKATYSWSQNGMHGSGSASHNYDRNAYVPGETLVNIVEDEVDSASSVGGGVGIFILVLVFAIVGLVGVLSPETAWHLNRGWMYKNAEPSDAALTMHRISGALLLVTAAVVLFLSCTGA